MKGNIMPKVALNDKEIMKKKTVEEESTETKVSSNSEDKINKLSNIDNEPKKKHRGRPKGSKNKKQIDKELQEELQIGEKAISQMTSAFFMLVEGVSSIWLKPPVPFTQVEKDTKKNFDKSVVTCMDYYLPSLEVKHLPLVYLGLTGLGITMDVLHKRHDMKVEMRKKEQEDKNDGFVEEEVEEQNSKPIEVQVGI